MNFRLFFHYLLYHLCNHQWVSSLDFASFYGASYIVVPLQEAKSTTEISFSFRTKQSDALLFVAAGRTDYCLLRLASGRLKAQINLGAGESEVTSPKGLRLDDLIWHQVTLSRKDAQVNITVDRIHQIKERLPGKFFELNIYNGLFVGGVDDSLELFLGHLEWLRGCVSAVFYNGMEVLKRARQRQLGAEPRNVAWSCSSEFDASLSSEISFLDDNSYLAFANPIGRTGAKLSFEMKTESRDAIMLYNSKAVSGGKTDYVGLQLVDGQLHLVTNTGSGVTRVSGNGSVSDGEWHRVSAQCTPLALQLTVDGVTTATQHAYRQANKYLDLSDRLYVGGVELNKRASALSAGITTAANSFKGCLRNLDADGNKLGLPNAIVTQSLVAVCAWNYRCPSRPCVQRGVSKCFQKGVDSFACDCDRKPDCVNETYDATKKISALDLEVISLTTLHVTEGESSWITSDNVAIVLDYGQYNLSQGDITLHVDKLPLYGTLLTEGSETIRLTELLSDKVQYSHDGSENFVDSISFEVELAAKDKALPAYLSDRLPFTLPIKVLPVNDPPNLWISREHPFTVAEGTRKVLSSEYLNATDADNTSEELVYAVVNQDSRQGGQLEKWNFTGVAIERFTQADIDAGAIVYSHAGNSTKASNIYLTVSDGETSTAVEDFLVIVRKLQLELVRNSGITLVRNSAALITKDHLAFQTNAEDPIADVEYQIISAAKYGKVQVCHFTDDGQESWQSANRFTGKQIADGCVRYIHIEQAPNADYFKFKVSTKTLDLPTTYEFRITFVELSLSVAVNKRIESDKQSVPIGEGSLFSTTLPLPIDKRDIVYQLLTTPLYSDIVLRNTALKVNETWTQKDISEGKLHFRLSRRTYSRVNDSARFKVSAPNCRDEGPAFLLLSYFPPPEMSAAVRVTNEPMRVTEGDQQPILSEYLNILPENVSLVSYRVVSGPRHGWFELSDVDHIAVENVTQFTNKDIYQQKVMYAHDDSESQQDYFEFLATGFYGEDFQYVDTFNIEVKPRNDNPPYAIHNEILYVVTGGEKLLTKEVLLFGDADVDTSAQDIVFTHKRPSNGMFMMTREPFSTLTQFTQDDVNNHRVMFHHEGTDNPEDEWMRVSDSAYGFEFELEVDAAPPYVRAVNNSKVLVEQMGQVTLTTENLYYESNVNALDNDIRYEITEGPEAGTLVLADQSEAANSFTQEDVIRGRLSYRHAISVNRRDAFRYQVVVKETVTEGRIQVYAFPSAYWKPMVVANNKTILVEETTTVLISSNDLQVVQSDVPPSDIVYVVIKAPEYGYLELDNGGGGGAGEEGGSVGSFRQSDVDGGKVHYVQSVTNQTDDRIVVDVSNGVLTMRRLLISFVVIPEHLYISAEELQVEEGGVVKFTPSLFLVQTPYYVEKISEYKVARNPRHGWLQYVGSTTKVTNISTFTIAQLNNRQLQYAHDGSETTHDSATLIAYARDQESVPFSLSVNIMPVNDEIPLIVNNTPATVWRGATCILDSSNIAVLDKDTPAENVTYVVVKNVNGHAVNYTNRLPIDKFTQYQVDRGTVAFAHSGSDGNGEMEFAANDGIHVTDVIKLSIISLEPKVYLSRNVNLPIFPSLRKLISPQYLVAWCSDANRNPLFVVKKNPIFGKLISDTDLNSAIGNFTQSDLNATKVWYHHLASFGGHSIRDSFVFDVACDYTKPIVDQEFVIDIAVSSGGLDGLLDIESYQVEEGGAVRLAINTSNILKFLSEDNSNRRNNALKAVVISPPKNGLLCIGDRCGLSEFTNEELNDESISYVHDHSDTDCDKVTFSIQLTQDGKVMELSNVTTSILVNPVNDQPFTLTQASPALTVVQGDTFVLTDNELLTVDKDTGADGITYSIVNGPEIGHLYVKGKRMTSFTQADIKQGNVAYEHTGPVQESSFHFRVSDGHHTPTYSILHIRVRPATLSVTVKGTLLIRQGTTSKALPESLFEIRSNLNKDNILYEVIASPKHGYIIFDNGNASSFKHEDLKSGKIWYVCADFNSTDDFFELRARFPFDDSPVATKLLIYVSVEPMIEIGLLEAHAATRNLIDKEALNAEQLLKLTESNPVFRVLKKPKYGKIKKIYRRTGDSKAVREKETNKFSYEEIRSGVIFYVAKKLNATVEDGFAFVLEAEGVRPAVGEIRFFVTADPAKINWFGKNRNKSNKSMETSTNAITDLINIELATPNISDDYTLMLSLLIGVLVTSVLFVFAMRCRNKKRYDDNVKLMPPLPLPRPPDDLMPISAGLMGVKRGSNGSPEPIDFPSGSEPDFNSRYPYGDEDWSSYETGSRSQDENPMLRRNQYWV